MSLEDQAGRVVDLAIISLAASAPNSVEDSSDQENNAAQFRSLVCLPLSSPILKAREPKLRRARTPAVGSPRRSVRLANPTFQAQNVLETHVC